MNLIVSVGIPVFHRIVLMAGSCTTAWHLDRPSTFRDLQPKAIMSTGGRCAFTRHGQATANSFRECCYRWVGWRELQSPGWYGRGEVETSCQLRESGIAWVIFSIFSHVVIVSSFLHVIISSSLHCSIEETKSIVWSTHWDYSGRELLVKFSSVECIG